MRFEGDDVLTLADLEDRRNYLCASDVPAILGLCPHRGPWDVWLNKTQPAVEPVNTPEQMLGHTLEPALASLYAAREGAEVSAWCRLYQDGWMACTPDFRVNGGAWGLECKALALPLEGWGMPGTDDVREDYRTQVEFSMMTAGVPRWDVVVAGMARDLQAYLGDVAPEEARRLFLDLVARRSRMVEVRFYTVAASPRLQAALMTRCEAWWFRHITMGIRPDVDGSDAAGRGLVATSTGGTVDDQRALSLMLEYGRARGALDVATAAEALARQRLQEHMGGAEEARDPRGIIGRIGWKSNKAGSRVWSLRGFNVGACAPLEG